MEISIEGINVSSIVLIILFVIPGSITDKIIRYRFPERKESPTKLLLDSIFYSCLNYAFFLWLVILSLRYIEPGPQIAWPFFLAWIGIILVGPFLLACLIVRLMTKFPALGLLHPIPTAWDYHFGKRRSYWVLVAFKDGSQIGRLYSKSSFASSFPQAQDLYIEQLWEVAKGGILRERIEDSAGAWVDMDNVQTLEFWEVK